MKQKKKKKSPGKYIGLILSMLIGAVCGVVIVTCVDFSLYYGDGIRAALHFGLFMLGMLVAFYLQFIIHEAGHLVFGLISGYGFSSFRIGSLMWLKTSSGLRFKKLALAGTGGQCLMTPPELVDGRMPFKLYNLGGSLMNLISALLFFGLYLLCSSAELNALLLMLAVIGLALALINGLPLSMGPVDNDGRNALAMSKSPQALRAFWIQLKINQLTAAGQRLRDMPEEWFALPEGEDMGNSMCAAIAVFAANRLMDQQRFEEADALMSSLLSGGGAIVGLYSSLMLCDRIYCLLISSGNLEELPRLYTKAQQKFMRSMKNFPSVIRTGYAIALLSENDAEKAQKQLRLFEKISASYPHPRELELERQLMEIAAKKQAEGPVATGS